jgi:type IX secretion system PorP/SprF family membrane protein
MRKLLILLLLISSAKELRAQQDEQMSIYMYNPLYFNPAYAGSKDAISMTAVGRFQWINFKGAPRSQWFSIHAPLLFKSLGVGGHLVNDRIGTRDRTSVFADISGSIAVSKNKRSRLAAGLSVGVDVMGYDFTNSTVNDVNDPYFGQQFSATKPNVGAGLFYYGDKFYVGLSSPRLLEGKIRTDQDLVKQVNARHFFLAAGYVFDLNSVLKLKPSMLFKYTPKTPITFDVNVSLLSYERLWTGIMYRFHESIGANVGVIIKNFTFGYVYDFPINGLLKHQSGSHEIFLQLDVKTKKLAYTSPRYF